VHQSVAQAFSGADRRLAEFNGILNGLQHVGDGALFGKWWE
jgi:hypothetical protein